MNTELNFNTLGGEVHISTPGFTDLPYPQVPLVAAIHAISKSKTANIFFFFSLYYWILSFTALIIDMSIQWSGERFYSIIGIYNVKGTIPKNYNTIEIPPVAFYPQFRI